MKKSCTNIYLIGPMGAGKTSTGKQLSKLMKRLFYDSDQEIKKRIGSNIPWIFRIEGESNFRRYEREMINTLCRLNNIILATGGGAVLHENNRDQLSQNGIVIYLTTTIETQLKRVRQKGEIRPIFLKNNSKGKLQGLNEMRRSFYQAIADFIYPTDNLNSLQLATQILTDIKKNYSKS